MEPHLYQYPVERILRFWTTTHTLWSGKTIPMLRVVTESTTSVPIKIPLYEECSDMPSALLELFFDPDTPVAIEVDTGKDYEERLERGLLVTEKEENLDPELYLITHESPTSYKCELLKVREIRALAGWGKDLEELKRRREEEERERIRQENHPTMILRRRMMEQARQQAERDREDWEKSRRNK